jgi:hypothetical protein
MVVVAVGGISEEFVKFLDSFSVIEEVDVVLSALLQLLTLDSLFFCFVIIRKLFI